MKADAMNDTGRERVVALAGGHNFRDIGGYATTDGRGVAWGKVFRSGTMADLTDADHATLEPLGIVAICDFRSNRERRHRPSRLGDSAVEPWSRDHETSAADLVNAMRAPGVDVTVSRGLMIELYRTMAYEQAESYRELFRRIAAGDLPIVFHCSAGKDRTGIAAALLLDVLGVDRATVVEDYVLTDRFLAGLLNLISREPDSRRYAAIDPAILAPMMRADPVYIETMFDTIEQRHGSSAGFLAEVLGMDAAAVAGLRDRLLV
jgi:protein-tyrosine phosphatase